MIEPAAASVDVLMARLGLDRQPFPVTPDPGRYFRTPALESHLAELLHCIEARKGFMLVTADVGLGKTTLSRRLIGALEEKETRVSLVFNSFLRREALLGALLKDFGLPPGGGMTRQLATFNRFLLAQFRKGRNCCLLIDDAQHLDLESLELIRQLSNLETDEQKLVQIVLIAQPEITRTLALPEMRQLNSRICLHAALSPYGLRESDAYIRHRLEGAGNRQGISLSPLALWLIWRASRGYPRQINLIMDRSLYALVAMESSRIDAAVMRRAIGDLGRLKTAARPAALPRLAAAPLLAALIGAGIFYLGSTLADHLPSALASAAETPAREEGGAARNGGEAAR